MIKFTPTTTPKKEMVFVYIQDHYDVHLTGLCRYKNKLCKFKIVDEDAKNPEYFIFSLGFIEKIRLIIEKKLFELCVGKHWTYKNGKRQPGREPSFIGDMLQEIFYVVHKN